MGVEEDSLEDKFEASNNTVEYVWFDGANTTE